MSVSSLVSVNAVDNRYGLAERGKDGGWDPPAGQCRGFLTCLETRISVPGHEYVVSSHNLRCRSGFFAKSLQLTMG